MAVRGKGISVHVALSWLQVLHLYSGLHYIFMSCDVMHKMIITNINILRQHWGKRSILSIIFHCVMGFYQPTKRLMSEKNICASAEKNANLI